MVHDAAFTGFGAEASRYQNARPAYHPDLVQRFVNRFGSGQMLEIAAGTGKFTSQLVSAGVRPVAVEPVDAMRAILAEDLPNLDVQPGTAEDLPAGGHTFDTVVAAQAFHWFNHGPALDEIHRVLRPSGHLVTVWNVKEGDADWYRRYMAIINRFADDTPRHAHMQWRQAIDTDPRFELVDDWQIDNSQNMDREAVVDRALSISFIAALQEPTKASVAAELRAVVADVETPIRFPYRGELQAWTTGG
ncbi:MAG: class I SAM-dependent methyltransferase [Actinomycetota bacterium]